MLTAVYNRADTLVDAYHSLCAQTFRDFEWIVIDDGSTEPIRELIASWLPFFPIRYTRKPNGGKYTAINIGVAQAAGDFTLILDSDDSLLPNALERFDFWTRQPPDPERIATFVALFYQSDGKTLFGKPFPTDCVDVGLAEYFKLPVSERCGVMRTSVFRQFQYPIFPGERYIPDGVVWNRMTRRYPARYFNEPLAIWGGAPGHQSSRRLLLRNPRGGLLYYVELARAPVAFRVRARAALLAGACLLLVSVRSLWLGGARLLQSLCA